jgi:hypothetical protein
MRWLWMSGIFFVCLLISQTVAADPMDGFCTSEVEGTYQGRLNEDDVRVNLFCVDENRLAATVCPSLGKDRGYDIAAVTNLSNAKFDGDNLVLASFGLENSDRRAGSSKSLISYFRVDLAEFRKGHLTGIYMTGNMSAFQRLDAHKTGSFPQLTSALKEPLPAKAIIGVFKTDMPEDIKAVNLVFDILLGTPVVSLAGTYSHIVNHFTDGPLWDENTGLISIMTAEGNGGEPDDKKLYYMRGRALDANRIEYYVISPVKGLRGPFHAERISSFVNKIQTRAAPLSDFR